MRWGPYFGRAHGPASPAANSRPPTMDFGTDAEVRLEGRPGWIPRTRPAAGWPALGQGGEIKFKFPRVLIRSLRSATDARPDERLRDPGAQATPSRQNPGLGPALPDRLRWRGVQRGRRPRSRLQHPGGHPPRLASSAFVGHPPPPPVRQGQVPRGFDRTAASTAALGEPAAEFPAPAAVPTATGRTRSAPISRTPGPPP